MKTILKFFALILVLLVGLFLAAGFLADTVLKKTLSSLSSDATGTPVDVESLNLNIRTGTIRLENLRVGNPPGYKAEYALKIASVRARIDSRSLFSDTIHVHTVEILQPDVVYEIKGPTTNNIRRIKENIDSYMAKKRKRPGESKKTTKIDRLSIRDGKVRAAASLLGGKGVTVDMPDVELEHIDTGKEEKGSGAGAAISVVLARILESVLGVAGQAAGGVGKGLEHAGSSAADAAAGLLKGLRELAPSK